MSPRLQLRLLLTIGLVQVPAVVVAVVQTSPPLPGSTSVRVTLLAAALPATAGLLTTMVKVAWPPMVNDPPSGVFTTFNCAAVLAYTTLFRSCAVSPPVAVAMAAGLG